MITEYPSEVRDMSFEDYLADPCDTPSLTASIAKRLNAVAPARVRAEVQRLNPGREVEANNSAKFDLGSAVHMLVTGKGDELAVVQAPDYRTKAAREARDMAYAEHRTPLLEREHDQAFAMAGMFLPQFAQTELAHLADHMEAAIVETSLFWREAGTACRCRPDFLWADGSEAIILHFKTVADVNSLARYAIDLGWDVTHAHYAEGVRAVFGCEVRQVFALQEKKPPHLLQLVELDGAFQETGNAARSRALDIWAKCVQRDYWPGHSARVRTLEAPMWHETAVMERLETSLAGLDNRVRPAPVAE